MYFKRRYGLQEIEMLQFFHQYRHIPQTRTLIEKAFKEFIQTNRMKGIKTTEFRGIAFLNEIQELIIKLYRNTKMGEILPDGYPMIVWFRNCTHREFGIALTEVKKMLKYLIFWLRIRNCTHSHVFESFRKGDNCKVLWIIPNINRKLKIEFGIALTINRGSFRNCTHSAFGIALTGIRNCTHRKSGWNPFP